MGRKNCLNQEEKTRITTLRDCGLCYRQLTKKISRSCYVRNLIMKGENYVKNWKRVKIDCAKTV